MKKKILLVMSFIALFLLPLGAAKAMDAKTGSSIYVAPDEIVSGNLYAAGNTLTIDGNVSGDLIAAAQNITVNGRVEGDIIAAAQEIVVNGEVGGNVRIAGNSLSLNGTVARNANVFGSKLRVGEGARIGWDLLAMGMSLEMRGTVEGSVSGNVDEAIISGRIGKDLDLGLAGGKNGALVIAPEAVVNGNIDYRSKKTAQISEKASVGGEVKQAAPTEKERNWFSLWAWSKLYGIFAALVVGLVLVTLGRKLTPLFTKQMEEKPMKLILPGLVLMFVLPPVALVLAITVIGLPLALIIAAWWLVAAYVAKILAAILLGQIILRKLSKKEPALIWSLVLGVFVAWLLFAIPFIGWIICMIAIWLGLGGIWTYASSQLRNL